VSLCYGMKQQTRRKVIGLILTFPSPDANNYVAGYYPINCVHAVFSTICRFWLLLRVMNTYQQHGSVERIKQLWWRTLSSFDGKYSWCQMSSIHGCCCCCCHLASSMNKCVAWSQLACMHLEKLLHQCLRKCCTIQLDTPFSSDAIQDAYFRVHLIRSRTLQYRDSEVSLYSVTCI